MAKTLNVQGLYQVHPDWAALAVSTCDRKGNDFTLVVFVEGDAEPVPSLIASWNDLAANKVKLKDLKFGTLASHYTNPGSIHAADVCWILKILFAGQDCGLVILRKNKVFSAGIILDKEISIFLHQGVSVYEVLGPANAFTAYDMNGAVLPQVVGAGRIPRP